MKKFEFIFFIVGMILTALFLYLGLCFVKYEFVNLHEFLKNCSEANRFVLVIFLPLVFLMGGMISLLATLNLRYELNNRVEA